MLELVMARLGANAVIIKYNPDEYTYVYYDFETTGKCNLENDDIAEAVELAAYCPSAAASLPKQFEQRMVPASKSISARSSYIHGIYKKDDGTVGRVTTARTSDPVDDAQRETIRQSLQDVKAEMDAALRKWQNCNGRKPKFAPPTFESQVLVDIQARTPLYWTKSSTTKPQDAYTEFTQWLLAIHTTAPTKPLCLVSFNGASFDDIILTTELSRYGYVLPPNTVFYDVMQETSNWMNNAPSWDPNKGKLLRNRLIDVYAYCYGAPMGDAHIAMGDVDGLADVHALMLIGFRVDRCTRIANAAATALKTAIAAVDADAVEAAQDAADIAQTDAAVAAQHAPTAVKQLVDARAAQRQADAARADAAQLLADATVVETANAITIAAAAAKRRRESGDYPRPGTSRPRTDPGTPT